MPRSGPPREIPPPLELDCLRSLWKLKEGNVRAVQQALGPGRKLAYTTIMTVLERLVRKGAVTRRKSGRAFLYVPALSRERLRRLAVRQLVDTYFEGSPDALLAYLRNGDREPPREPEEDVSLDPALL